MLKNRSLPMARRLLGSIFRDSLHCSKFNHLYSNCCMSYKHRYARLQPNEIFKKVVNVDVISSVLVA